MKKKLVMTLVAIALILAIAVPAAAAAGNAASGPKGLLDYCKGLVQQLVADKKLAQSDADQVLAALDAKGQELAAERQDKGPQAGLAFRLGLAETAEVLGLTADDLSARLKAGATLWKVAADAGKLEDLKTAIIRQLTARLDALASAGRLTSEQAADKLAEATARIKAITADSDETLRDLALPDLRGRTKGGMPDAGMKQRGPRDGGKSRIPGSKAVPAPEAEDESSS